MLKLANEGFQRTLKRSVPVDKVPEKQVDRTLAKGISLVGKHALDAQLGFEKARLVGGEEDEVPTKEIQIDPFEGPAIPEDPTAAAAPGESTVINITEGQEAPFITKEVFDPDAELNLNQISKAREQGLISKDEAEARVRAATASSINRMPGRAAEFRRAASDFFSKFGPGGGALSLTDTEKIQQRIMAAKAMDDFEISRVSSETGIPENTIRERRSRAQLAQWNKVVFAEDLARFSAEAEVDVSYAMDQIVKNTRDFIVQQGGILPAKEQGIILAQLGAIRNNAIRELEKTQGYRTSDFGSQKAAKDKINAIYDRYAQVLGSQDAAEIMTKTFTELNQAAKVAMARRYPVTHQQVAMLGPEVVNKFWEFKALNPDLFTAIEQGDQEGIRRRKAAIERYGDMFFIMQETFERGNEAYNTLMDMAQDKAAGAMQNQRIEPGAWSGYTRDHVSTVFRDSTVTPGEQSSQSATNAALNYSEESPDKFLALTDLATMEGRQHVLKTPGALEQLERIIVGRITQDFMRVRGAELQEAFGPEFLGTTEFDETSQFLARARDVRRTPAEFYKQEILENSSLTQQLLRTYPEIWRGKYSSPEAFIEDKFNVAKQALEEQAQVTETVSSMDRLAEMDAQLEEIRKEIAALEGRQNGGTKTEE